MYIYKHRRDETPCEEHYESLEAALYTACVDYLESLAVPTAITDEADNTVISYDLLVREIERLKVH